jgi:preprotein translocase subunit YajC
MSFLISDAMAASADAAQQPGGLSMLVMPAVFILIFYFLLWRPQAKRAKEQRQLIESIKKGDEIVTSGGILGRVNKVSDKFLTVSVSEEVEIKIQRSAVSTVLPKGTLKSA